MTDSTPLVSVVIPAYNAERYIQRTVESILAQTCRDWELILVDDASSDQTLSIARNMAAADPRIRVVACPHQGVVATTNAGMALARGMYIAHLDADDVSHPSRLARQTEYLDAHPEVCLVGSNMRLVDEDGDVFNHTRYATDHATMDRLHLSGLNQTGHSTWMFRAELARRLEGYRSPYSVAADFEFLLRASEIGEMANLEERLVDYRVHGGNISGTGEQRVHDETWSAVNEARARRNLPAMAPPPFRPRPRWLNRSTARASAGAALMAGYPAAARKWAWRNFKDQPLHPTAWGILLIVGLRQTWVLRAGYGWWGRRHSPTR